MKQLFTIAFVLCALIGFGQQNTTDISVAGQKILFNTAGKRTIDPASKYSRPARANKGDNRAQNVNFIIDYGYLDEQYASNVTSGDYYDDRIFQVGRRLPIDSSFTLRWAFQWYPQIVDADNVSAWPFIEYPASKIQMTIDTILVSLGHIRNSNSTDTIVVSVWDFDNLNTISFADSGCTGTLYGRAMLTVDSSLTGAGSQAGTIAIGTFPFVPATPIVIPQGKRFVIQVDFFGQNNDEFYLLAGRRNDCANATCGSSLPYIMDDYNAQVTDFNSLGAIRFGAGTSQAGQYPTTFFYNDCNGNQGGPDSTDCEFFTMSDLYIFPNIKAVIPDFYAAIASDVSNGCPGATATLTASAGGSSSTPYTYAWSTSSGTLSSTSDPQVNLTLGGTNAVVTVTVTDASNQTVSETFTITSRAVTVSVSSANPLVINCGGTGTITTTIGGTTTGKNYVWSTGATGANTTTVAAQYPGNYSVTVTNSFGCSASAATSVQYPGGLNNNINFTVPGGQKCKGQSITFTNTSDRTAGWDYTWTFGDGNFGIGTKDGSNIYQNPGSYNVKLEQDSAGCKFTSTTKSVTIANCTGLDDVAFSNNVSIVPNPTNGNVTININGAEGNVTVKLYNIIGSELKSFTSNDVNNNFSRVFDYSDLPTGTYLVKVQTGNKTAVKRLAISK